MHIKTTGIVLYKRATGDNDSIVTILTDDYGVLGCYLKGAPKISSSTSAPTQQFCYSSFVLFKNRERYIIDSAESIEPFLKLRGDVVNLSLANYFGEIARELCSDAGSREHLRLLLNTLHLLQTGKRSGGFLKSVFEMRMLSQNGYLPDFSECCECGDACDDGAYFYYADSVVRCKKCAEGDSHEATVLTPSVLAALRHIVYSPMDRLFSFELTGESADMLEKITERYLLCKIDRALSSLQFYRSLVNM